MTKVIGYREAYMTAPCDRCRGGRIDYDIEFEDGTHELVCTPCARTTLVRLAPTESAAERER